MMSIKVSGAETSVAGVETDVGMWIIAPESFADFFDTALLPESFTVLGGTMPVVSDWQSPEAFVRAEMFIKVAQNYLVQEFGLKALPTQVEIVGLEPFEENVAPEDAVF